MNDVWNEYVYFPTLVYKLQKPEFLKSVMEVSEQSLAEYEKENRINTKGF